MGLVILCRSMIPQNHAQTGMIVQENTNKLIKGFSRYVPKSQIYTENELKRVKNLKIVLN